mmetsp:Transcript_18386/g.61522  ORF Transcript_18386/g.61522 Transcript_18386/m.61522 type:complete len:216 (-) Transcript_18386:855-1502(-)
MALRWRCTARGPPPRSPWAPGASSPSTTHELGAAADPPSDQSGKSTAPAHEMRGAGTLLGGYIAKPVPLAPVQAPKTPGLLAHGRRAQGARLPPAPRRRGLPAALHPPQPHGALDARLSRAHRLLAPRVRPQGAHGGRARVVCAATPVLRGDFVAPGPPRGLRPGLLLALPARRLRHCFHQPAAPLAPREPSHLQAPRRRVRAGRGARGAAGLGG